MIEHWRMSFQLWAVGSIHILSTSIHSSCEQYKLHTLVHTLLNAGLSWTPYSCSQVLKMIDYSNIPLSSDHQSNFIFWCFPKKERGKKSKGSRWECHLTLSLLDSAILLWDGMFELPESEFLMTHSKAKSTVPKRRCASHRGKRGLRSKRPQRSQWWIQNLNQKHGCMQEAFCYTNS